MFLNQTNFLDSSIVGFFAFGILISSARGGIIAYLISVAGFIKEILNQL